MDNVSAQKMDRTWDVLCHLSALSMFVGVPFGNIIGPVVVWLIKRGDSASVDEHGKESLNFQLSLTLYLISLTALTVGLLFILVGFLLLPVLIVAACVGPIVDLIFVIVAAVRASDGRMYRYPLTIRFLG